MMEWHNQHLKMPKFTSGDLILIYHNKFKTKIGKLKIYWLGPYKVTNIKEFKNLLVGFL